MATLAKKKTKVTSKKNAEEVKKDAEVVDKNLIDARKTKKRGKKIRLSRETEVAFAKLIFDKAYDEASNDSRATPGQILFGAWVGGMACYLDHKRTEPVGPIFAVTLLGLQFLDHEGIVQLPWNHGVAAFHPFGAHHPVRSSRVLGSGQTLKSIAMELNIFCWDNVYLFTGVAGGYLAVKTLLERQY